MDWIDKLPIFSPLFEIVLAEFEPFASCALSSRYFLIHHCKFKVTVIEQLNSNIKLFYIRTSCRKENN